MVKQTTLHSPTVAIDYFHNPLLHRIKGDMDYIWIRRPSLFRGRRMEVIHNVFHLEKKISFEL